MPEASPLLASFNAGELSPYMEGRVDQERYGSGCHLLQNFIPLVQGPAMRRPGSNAVNNVKNSANRTWLRKFEFSVKQAFQIEFGDFYLRFYTNHGQIQVPAGGSLNAWSNAIPYNVGDLVKVGSPLYVVYYCIAPNINQSPPNATYWYPIPTSAYEIPTPWPAAALTNSDGAFALKYEQSGDVLYICAGQSGYAPMTLTRYADTNWVLAPFAPTDGPWLTQNSDLTKAMWCTGQKGTVHVKSTFAAFAATDVGRLIRLQVQNFNTATWQTGVAFTAGQRCRFNGNTYLALNSATSGGSASIPGNPPIHIQGTAYDGSTAAPGVQWLYEDSGYGIGQITAFNSNTDVTVKVLKQFPAACIGTQATITGISQANPCVITCANSFKVGDMGFIFGVGGMVEINNTLQIATAVTGANLTLAQVDSTAYTAYTSGGTIVDQGTTAWTLGQWSNTTEWPRACVFFRGRLWMFGSLYVNGSVPGLYNSFALDTAGVVTADNSVQIVMSFDQVNTIQWGLALDRLFIGCDGGEFALYEQTPNQVLGPGNVQIVRQSQKRCSTVDPELINTTLLYVQRAGRKVLAADYDFTIDKYRSQDQTAWAYHITQTQVCDVTYAAEPWSILWYTRNDGTLIGLTFDREQNVYGWHRHVLGGSYQGGPAVCECVSAMPAPDGSRDELWMIVKRTINGATVRSIEYLTKGYEDGDAQSSCFYVDNGAGQTFSTGGVNPFVVSGLGYLQGQTVSILCNGAVLPDQVVNALGQVSISLNAMPALITVNIGLKYQSVLVTERPEAGAMVGTSQGKTKRTSWAAVRLYNTLGGSFGIDGLLGPDGNQLLDEFQYRTPAVPMDQAPPLFTGDFVLAAPPSDYDSDNRIRIEQDQPLPMTIVGLYPKTFTYEPS